MVYKLNLPEIRSASGSPMGRRNYLPEDRERPYLLHLTRVPLVDGGYDKGGVYWGASYLRLHYPSRNKASYNPLYCAEYDDGQTFVFIFVRPTVNWYADSNEWREAAKREIRKLLPNARFYR